MLEKCKICPKQNKKIGIVTDEMEIIMMIVLVTSSPVADFQAPVMHYLVGKNTNFFVLDS